MKYGNAPCQAGMTISRFDRVLARDRTATAGLVLSAPMGKKQRQFLAPHAGPVPDPPGIDMDERGCRSRVVANSTLFTQQSGIAQSPDRDIRKPNIQSASQ